MKTISKIIDFVAFPSSGEIILQGELKNIIGTLYVKFGYILLKDAKNVIIDSVRYTTESELESGIRSLLTDNYIIEEHLLSPIVRDAVNFNKERRRASKRKRAIFPFKKKSGIILKDWFWEEAKIAPGRQLYMVYEENSEIERDAIFFNPRTVIYLKGEEHIGSNIGHKLCSRDDKYYDKLLSGQDLSPGEWYGFDQQIDDCYDSILDFLPKFDNVDELKELKKEIRDGLIYPTTRIRKELIFRKLPQFNKILKKVASLTDRINILRYRIESLG